MSAVGSPVKRVQQNEVSVRETVTGVRNPRALLLRSARILAHSPVEVNLIRKHSQEWLARRGRV